jgi:mRNA-degrading endonuclease YafQ of YafQ-DinJ toxin-antitoxin module
MSSYELVLSAAFQRQVKKLVKKNPKLKDRVAKTLKLLAKNINHSSLKLHKLSGENNWSVSVTSDVRVIIHLSGSKVFCTRIGSHDEVY